jgi:translocation and assembly module TamA
MSLLRFLSVALGVICYSMISASPAMAQQIGDEAVTTQVDTKSAAEQDLLTSTTQLITFRFGIAQGEWLGLVKQHVPELSGSADPQIVTPGVLLKIRRSISALLSTEGYFSPSITFNKNGDDLNVILINIEAGDQSKIRNLDIQFSGALEEAIKAGQETALAAKKTLIENWVLPSGSAFRDGEWKKAKNQLSENLRADNYAAATITDSVAEVDSEKRTVDLRVEVDSGPVFLLGEINVTGLERFPLSLIERFDPPKKGERYSRTRLLEYQLALQNSAYFSSVAVSVDADPLKAEAVPIDVAVVERRTRDLALGTGYSTNTGFRTEVSYRDRNLIEKAWDLRSAVRLEQRRQLAYADIYLPPRARDQMDSFGVLFDRLDVSGQLQNRSAFGVKRTSNVDHLERRLGINLTLEKSQLDGEAEQFSRALVASFGWTWRYVDDQFAPRKGHIIQTDAAISTRAIVSDQTFTRLYAKYQAWIPVGKEDSVLLRAEVGKMFSASLDGIPEDYLFRTGGSTTVRGYPYQSLGVQHPEGVSGGSVVAVASAEYVHWFNSGLGGAVFFDIGDAAESSHTYSAKQGFGAGLRVKTPAGPLAFDLAYGKQSEKFRLDVSIAIAF